MKFGFLSLSLMCNFCLPPHGNCDPSTGSSGSHSRGRIQQTTWNRWRSNCKTPPPRNHPPPLLDARRFFPGGRDESYFCDGLGRLEDLSVRHGFPMVLLCFFVTSPWAINPPLEPMDYSGDPGYEFGHIEPPFYMIFQIPRP